MSGEKAPAMNAPAETANYALSALPPELAADFALIWRTAETAPPDWEALETLVTDLALNAPEVAPPPGLRDQLLARIANLEQDKVCAAATPECVKAKAKPDTVTTSRWSEGPWTPLAAGVLAKVLHRDHQTGMVTSLIKLEPGGYLPRHRHLGLEQTLVVAGDCRVNGETFYAGDFRLRPADTEDTEVTTEHGTTIMLIAPACFENLDPHWPR